MHRKDPVGRSHCSPWPRSQPGPVGVAPSATAKSAKQYRIALVTGDNHDPFYVTMNLGAQAEAEKLGVKVTWQGPATFEAAPQITVLDAVLASKPELPARRAHRRGGADRADQAVRQSHHVPVITVDTDVNDHSVAPRQRDVRTTSSAANWQRSTSR